MRKFDIRLGECSEDAHCFVGNDEKCCCGQTKKRDSVQRERDRYKAALEEISNGYHCTACSCGCHIVAGKAIAKGGSNADHS